MGPRSVFNTRATRLRMIWQDLCNVFSLQAKFLHYCSPQCNLTKWTLTPRHTMSSNSPQKISISCEFSILQPPPPQNAPTFSNFSTGGTPNSHNWTGASYLSTPDAPPLSMHLTSHFFSFRGSCDERYHSMK